MVTAHLLVGWTHHRRLMVHMVVESVVVSVATNIIDDSMISLRQLTAVVPASVKATTTVACADDHIQSACFDDHHFRLPLEGSQMVRMLT